MTERIDRPQRQESRTLRGLESEYEAALRNNSPWGAEHARREAKRLALRLGVPVPLWVQGWRR